MDQVRSIAALLVLLTVPLALIYWFTVHPLIRLWRRLGPALTYTVLTPLMIAVLVGSYWVRAKALGTDLGLNVLLCGLGVVLLVISTVIGQQMKKQFTITKLLGVPEIKGQGSPGELVTGGIFSRVRHPRYLSILLGLAGFALVANYLGVYVILAVFIPGIYLVILMEERELVERFGDAYREYSNRVPRLIPKLFKR